MTSVYRTAFVVQDTGYDFSDLLKICDDIKFLTSGREPEDQMMATLFTKLKSFEADKDVIVPVGNVATNLLVGALLYYFTKVPKIVTVALYKDRQYHVREVLFGWRQFGDTDE